MMGLTLVKFNEKSIWAGMYAVRNNTIFNGFPTYLDLEFPDRFSWGMLDTHFKTCVLPRPELLIEVFGNGIVRKTKYMDFFDRYAKSMDASEVAMEILSGN